MSDEEKIEKAVEVTLPEDPIVEVELSDNTAKIEEEKPQVREKSEPEPITEKKIDEREKALAEMKRQYEHQKMLAQAEREARQKAEYFARQQAQQVGQARVETQDTNLRLILNAIDATEAEAERAERDYAEATAAGDHLLAAKAQRAMARAESHLLQLNNGKEKLEQMLQYSTAEGAVHEPQIPSFEPQVPLDPVEKYAAQLSPKSAQWLREHPEVVNKVGKLTRAHQDAIEDGYTAESPEYFRYIEGRLGYSTPQQEEVEPQQDLPERVSTQSAPPKKSLVSAPVSSSTTSVSPRTGNSNTMVLSPQEVETALALEPEMSRSDAIAAYAKSKAILIKQGKLPG